MTCSIRISGVSIFFASCFVFIVSLPTVGIFSFSGMTVITDLAVFLWRTFVFAKGTTSETRLISLSGSRFFGICVIRLSITIFMRDSNFLVKPVNCECQRTELALLCFGSFGFEMIKDEPWVDLCNPFSIDHELFSAQVLFFWSGWCPTFFMMLKIT